jgi:hypothetical protein
MDRRLEELIERGVIALEKLVDEEIEIKVETKPPVCPHCHTMNPTVRVGETDQSGPLAEFVLQAYCMNCHNFFYVIPLQTECVRTVEDASSVIDEKVRLGGYQGQDPGAALGSHAAGAGGM